MTKYEPRKRNALYVLLCKEQLEGVKKAALKQSLQQQTYISPQALIRQTIDLIIEQSDNGKWES